MFIINPRNEVEVTVVTDGTTTEAVVRLDGVSEPFAKGTAKRRRGDRRNPEVGILLALARAFEDGAGELRKSLADLGYEEPGPEEKPASPQFSLVVDGKPIQANRTVLLHSYGKR